MTRSDRGAINVQAVVLIALVALLAGAGFYVYMSAARDTAQAGADVVTGATSAANTVAVAADVQNLRLAVESAVVDSGGHLPTVAFAGGHYVVSNASGTAETVPAGVGVSAAGITGGTEEDYCVWVAAANGITMHTTHSGEPQVGGC